MIFLSNFVGMKYLYLSLFLVLTVCSCRHYHTQQPAQDTSAVERLKNEALLRVNKELVEEEAEEIKTFAQQRNWQMETTETGLWYMIYENGKGEKAVEGKIATLDYTVSRLDSTICYTSKQLGQKQFLLGKGRLDGIEPGLEEGVLLMREGDKARLILLPHLAYGLTGDGDCIPRRAIILYDVELVNLK